MIFPGDVENFRGSFILNKMTLEISMVILRCVKNAVKIFLRIILTVKISMASKIEGHPNTMTLEISMFPTEVGSFHCFACCKGLKALSIFVPDFLNIFKSLVNCLTDSYCLYHLFLFVCGNKIE